MAAQFAHQLRVVATFLQQVQHTSAFGDVVKAQQAHFTKQLVALTFSVEDANVVMSALKEGPWPTDVSAALLGLVASKTTAGPSTVSRSEMQDYRWIVILADCFCFTVSHHHRRLRQHYGPHNIIAHIPS